MTVGEPIGGPHLALVGMMGSGKTTIGRVLSGQVDRSVVDLDTVLVARHGMAIPEMFTKNGETWFRDEEERLLAEAMGSDDGVIYSVGGGAVVRQASRAVLRERALVVWLRASAETLIERNGGGAGRPMLAGNPSERVRTLTAERAPIYAEVAHCVIDVDDLTAVQTADCIRAAIHSLDPAHWAR